jgi:hypothetical protein
VTVLCGEGDGLRIRHWTAGAGARFSSFAHGLLVTLQKQSIPIGSNNSESARVCSHEGQSSTEATSRAVPLMEKQQLSPMRTHGLLAFVGRGALGGAGEKLINSASGSHRRR